VHRPRSTRRREEVAVRDRLPADEVKRAQGMPEQTLRGVRPEPVHRHAGGDVAGDVELPAWSDSDVDDGASDALGLLYGRQGVRPHARRVRRILKMWGIDGIG
jgi:hypothetical protein